MNVALIPELLTNAILPQTTLVQSAADIDEWKKQYFKTLMKEPAVSPETMINAQKTINQLAVGSEITARICGGFVQTVSKLTELQ